MRRIFIGSGRFSWGCECGFEDKVFYPAPDGIVVLDFDVRVHEGTRIPTVTCAGDGIAGVIRLIVSQDAGAAGIDGLNGFSSVKDAVRLVEVYGFADVGRDAPVVFAGFFDAVDLNGEQDGDAETVEFAREVDSFGCSPTVAEKDDAGCAFFAFAQLAVVAGIERCKDGAKGLMRVMVGEGDGIDHAGIVKIEVSGKARFAVREIVAMNASAHEADDEQGRAGMRLRRRGCALRLIKRSDVGTAVLRG